MRIDDLIDRIAKAAAVGDWPRAQIGFVELRRVMVDDGRALSSAGAIRLVEAMAGGVALGQRMLGGQGDKALADMRGALNALPVDPLAIRTSWDCLYRLLADPSFDAEASELRDILVGLRSRRMFDLLAKTADRVLIRYPDDATARRLYGQALIDQGQLTAGIEVLESMLRSSPGAIAQKELVEIHGLLGRAHKQIYVDHVPDAASPALVRNRFRPHLQAAINSYARGFDPSNPSENAWSGINLIALLQLARDDGHGNIINPTQLEPKEIASRIIAALTPKAPTTTDPWLQATLAEAYLALGDLESAARYFHDFLAMKPDAFAIAGTVRQLDEVFRIKAGAAGSGPILAALKEAQIGQAVGRFSLDGDSLKQLGAFAASPEHRRLTESMVPDGGFVKLGLLQTVVARASAVAALCDASGATQGTGFLVKGSDLYQPWGDGLFLVTNAHVMSCPKSSAHVPDAPLTPERVRIVLEAAGGTPLQCEAKACWQSPVGQHDVTIVPIANAGQSTQINPLPICSPDTRLQPADADKPDSTKAASRVSVIGCPLGGPLSLSIVGNLSGANGLLVDIGPRRDGDKDPVYLHYRAPTEPGNSGSPVFDSTDWTVVGLHHEGFDPFDGRPRLGGRPGKSYANEGISIQSIRRTIRVRGG